MVQVDYLAKCSTATPQGETEYAICRSMSRIKYNILCLVGIPFYLRLVEAFTYF